MEEVLYGCDVMPSAVHITGSTLSGVEPSVLFNTSHLYTMPYGRMKDGSVMIGSLELLQSSDVLTLFNTSDPAMRTGSAGEETAAQIRAEIPNEGYDLALIHRRTACRRPAEETKGCASESGIMVLKQKTGPRKGASDRCYHVTTPTASKSPSTTTAWWPMPG